MEYQIQALLAVAVFFASFITWFVWHGGLEPGPLATWVSGLASTSAVVVALWGQWRVQKQRLEDQQEKLASAAYQLVIKSSNLLQFVKSIHKTFREKTTVHPIVDESGSFKIFDLDALGFLATMERISLTEAEENLFARIGALKELQKTNRALEGFRLLILSAGDHRQIQKDLLALAKKTDSSSINSMFVTWDVEDQKTRHLLILNSQTIETMHRLAEQAIESSIIAYHAMRKVAEHFVGPTDFGEIYLTRAKEEASLTMPRIEEDEALRETEPTENS